MRKSLIFPVCSVPISSTAHSFPDKVRLYGFCELNAAPAGEVASAACAEVGGVKTNFIKLLSETPQSRTSRDSSPTREPR